jgi:hypothetical protein
VRDDTNSLDHIHDLRDVKTRRCSSPINWRVRQSSSHHFGPQVFSSLLNKRVIGRSICVRSISLNLLFDVFVKHRDAVVRQRLQTHWNTHSLKIIGVLTPRDWPGQPSPPTPVHCCG